MAANAMAIVSRQIATLNVDEEDIEARAALAAKIRAGEGSAEDHALLLAEVEATLVESNPRALK